MRCASIARRILICLGSLVFLAGLGLPPEINSDPFEIPAEQRAVVPGLDGAFWIYSQANDYLRPGRAIAEFRLQPDRRYRMISHESSDPDETDDDLVTFLATDSPGIFVMVSNESDDSTRTLGLLARSRLSGWSMHYFLGVTESPIEGAREAYLDAVVRRHGFAPTGGPLNLGAVSSVAQVRGLFSDPDFLSALVFLPDETLEFYPMMLETMPDMSDPDQWWDEVEPRWMKSNSFEIDREDYVAKEDLPEAWQEAVTSFDDGTMEFKFSVGSAFFGLLDIGIEGKFLALSDNEVIAGGSGADDYEYESVFEYHLIEDAGDGGAQVSLLTLAAYDFSPKINDMVRSSREEAAQRHGLSLFGSTLTGANPESIRALFLDPQFQAGLGYAERAFRQLGPSANEAEAAGQKPEEMPMAE